MNPTPKNPDIKIKCPTRVDLAGGTLDLWPLYSFLGDCTTLNVAIDIFTEVDLTTKTDKSIDIWIPDLEFKKNYASLSEVLESKDKEVDLLRPILDHYKPGFGFELELRSQSPIGGGLGGSSSLTVAICEAFNRKLKRTTSTLDLVELVHNLEAKLLLTPTGTQDYFAPISKSGLQVIQYTASGITHEIHPIPKFVKDSFVLVYTGRPHHSGLNNWQVLKAVIDGDKAILGALADLQKVANEMKLALLEGDGDNIPKLLKSEFAARIKLTKAFSSPEIERLKKICDEMGKVTVKICGAGGGGCVLLWLSGQSREKVVERCVSEGFKVLDARPI